MVLLPTIHHRVFPERPKRRTEVQVLSPRFDRGRFLLLAVAASTAPLLAAVSAAAQFGLAARFQLSDDVRLDEADGNVQAQLRRVPQLLAAGQTGEALEVLLRAAEADGRKMIRVSPHRAVAVREQVQQLLAAGPFDALTAYRRRVDPQAEKWYQVGVTAHDVMLLRRIVEEAFLSSRGDDALLALGDLALERGDPHSARAWWQRLFDAPLAVIPAADFDRVRRSATLAKPDAALLDRYYVRRAGSRAADGAAWYVGNPTAWNAMTDDETAALVRVWRSAGLAPPRLAYPDSEFPKADVRARLVLAAIRAASNEETTVGAQRFAAAEEELARFQQLHPDARGYIAGQEQSLAEYLTRQLAEARHWPRPHPQRDWTTFAGAPGRLATSGAVDLPAELGAPQWRMDLGKPWAADVRTERELFREPRVAESWQIPMSHFPVMKGDLLFAATAHEILAWNARTGQPAWAAAGGQRPGVIFHEPPAHPLRGARWTIGVPRFTLSLHGDLLAARLGGPETAFPADDDTPRRQRRSKLVLLDVGPLGQGRLARDPLEAEDDAWSFDGTPLIDDDHLFVTLRRSEVRPQVHVACYDLSRNPPRLKWRSFVASAETPGSGQLVEYTHNLLTRHGETLFLNTNLGAVAALDAAGGAVQWVHLYPRAKLGNLNSLRDTAHFYRDLTPCLYHAGQLLVAPADAPAIFCLDADTGLLKWSTDAAPDVVHLLGIRHGRLIASGDRLYAVDLASGQLALRWPEEVRPDPRGHGRGVLVGEVALWPTTAAIYRFDLPASFAAGSWKPQQPPWQLTQLGLRGGNLLVAADRLIMLHGSEQKIELVAWPLGGAARIGPAPVGK